MDSYAAAAAASARACAASRRSRIASVAIAIPACSMRARTEMSGISSVAYRLCHAAPLYLRVELAGQRSDVDSGAAGGLRGGFPEAEVQARPPRCPLPPRHPGSAAGRTRDQNRAGQH
ncbi:hypothetical protein [Demequina litorisediminis]|uniref:hypothetical protein n=1 Tax=Demequina litorisediminis TaxID=1849022 RepID=UPI0024E186D6|nr:hypothetical protein [Demequina litorisediminis]